jgi:PTH1 family peptidyl-tRNA hydrolase
VKIVLGIGNIGDEYAGTRHNCGFAVLDLIAQEAGISFAGHRKWRATTATWPHPAGQVLLLKPATYVNGSGSAAQAAMAFYRVAPADLLVVVDDLNLELGTLRYRAQGGAGGHNGLRDIEAHIGQAYPRLRLGIGTPRHTDAAVDHVLSRFTTEERADVDLMITKAAGGVRDWVAGGDAAALRHNGPLHPPPARNAGPPPADPGAGAPTA